VLATGPVNEASVPTADRRGHLRTHEGDDITIFGRLDFVIRQPLYTFGKISNRKDAATLGMEAQMAAREQKRNEIILNVKELYYAYLVAAQGKSAAREADDFIQDAGKRIKRLIELKAKNADQSDLYRLDAYSAEVKSFQAKADSGAHVAYAALKKAAGIPDNVDFNLDITELPKKPVPLAAEDEYIQLALQQRPELTQVKKGADARGKLAEAAKADLYPSFFAAAVGSVAGAPGREHFDNSYFSDDFNHSYAGVVAGAEWHFDLGIGQGKLDKARAEHKKTLAAQDFATRNIPLEVVKYYQDALESQTGYKAYEQATVGSRRWIISAFTNFDVGVGTAKDMFDAIDRYGKNEGEYLRSLYMYHVSLARLNYAIGQKEDIH
jgi:outer membrane protein